MPTLDQKRAQFAWEHTHQMEQAKIDSAAAKSAPALIMTSGLMTTLAYFQEKGKQGLVDCITEWLARCLRPRLALQEKPRFSDVMNALQKAEPDIYRDATQEALLLLAWVKQFAAVKDTAAPARSR